MSMDLDEPILVEDSDVEFVEEEEQIPTKKMEMDSASDPIANLT